MRIGCPVCNQKQEFNFKLLFKERCNSCNAKFYLHYSKPIKLFRFLMQTFIFIIGIYILQQITENYYSSLFFLFLL